MTSRVFSRTPVRVFFSRTPCIYSYVFLLLFFSLVFPIGEGEPSERNERKLELKRGVILPKIKSREIFFISWRSVFHEISFSFWVFVVPSWTCALSGRPIETLVRVRNMNWRKRSSVKYAARGFFTPMAVLFELSNEPAQNCRNPTRNRQ